MARTMISGSNSAAVEPATGAMQYVLGKAVGSNREFWLRGIWYGPSATDGQVYLYDATSGTTSGTVVMMLPAATVAGDESKIFELPAPGLRFQTGVCTMLSVSGSLAIGEMGGCGYEQ